jgi:hypothetical protein
VHAAGVPGCVQVFSRHGTLQMPDLVADIPEDGVGVQDVATTTHFPSVTRFLLANNLPKHDTMNFGTSRDRCVGRRYRRRGQSTRVETSRNPAAVDLPQRRAGRQVYRPQASLACPRCV